ncbi:DtxR family transcriptional regulator [Clostridia bacterium]|nr:DtxR family transcriptional regulator [Clostridia bacterium]
MEMINDAVSPVALSSSLEDYIEAIYLLSEVSPEVRVSDIAGKLKVAKPSVHIALHALEERHFITHKRYGTVHLTDDGRSAAMMIYARHTEIKRFFEQVLKIDTDIAEKDACAAEHVLSPEAISAMSEMVKNI